jgi:hypothetical protein
VKCAGPNLNILSQDPQEPNGTFLTGNDGRHESAADSQALARKYSSWRVASWQSFKQNGLA